MNKLILKDCYTYEELYQAYIDCVRSKRYTNSALEFSINLYDNLMLLLDEINSGNYVPLPSNVFVVTYPKPREVWAGQFKDRIVQHLIYNQIGNFYEKRLIEDTYSCIKDRGISNAVNRFDYFCRSITDNWKNKAYCLKLDISNFFVSISKDILWNILIKDIGTSSLTSELIHTILFNDPTINPIRKGNKFDLVPKHKSLFNSRPNCGLPIGNLLSQFFSNVYLDSMDKYAKHILKCKYYIRYVDDILFLDKDRDRIYEISNRYKNQLYITKDLIIQESKTKVQPTYGGIDVLGTIILPYRQYVRKRLIRSFINAAEFYRLDLNDSIAQNSYTSYKGFLVHHNTFNIIKNYGVNE